MFNLRSVIRMAGSLWFAVVLLVVLMLSMANATVFESMNGTEQVLKTFYHALWFRILLALIAVNVLAAVVVRYPFSRRQLGFVMTHAGILLSLAGALVTAEYGVDGQLGIGEGETVDSFRIPLDTLTVMNPLDQSRAAIDLNPSVFSGLSAVDRPETEALSLGSLERIEVLQYLPDATWRQRILDDNTRENQAVEVSLSSNGRNNSVWIFAGKTETLSPGDAAFLFISDPVELNRLLQEQEKDPSGSIDKVKIEYEGSVFEIPLEDCLDEAVPVGDTGYSIRVLRYIPHAVVGQDNKVVSASEQPINPAIEAEISGPKGSEVRLSFANFPDFSSRHQPISDERLKLTFISAAGQSPAESLAIIGGPDGELYIRFAGAGTRIISHKVDVGKPCETPWPGQQITVLRYYDHARIEMEAVQVDPIRKNRVPALRLELIAPAETREIWLQKYRPRPVSVAGTPFELMYGEKAVPLDFKVTLNRFRVGYYPGGERPRSFESHITIMDPATGRAQDRIISMNSPAKHGGFTFYQSSYRLEAEGAVSFLSVSRDPGQLIAFTGYIATIIGMLLVLGTRMQDQRRKNRMKADTQNTGNG